MTPPSSRVPGTPTPPQAPETHSPTPDTGAAASSPSPVFRHVEIRAGGRYGLGDAFQLEAGVAVRPIAPLVLGANLQTNFTNRFSGSLEVGGRLRLSDAVSLQATAFGGLGGFFGYPIRAGRLSEDSSLSGLFGFLGADLRLVVEPTSGFNFFIGLGFNHEFRGETTPNRQTLVSGEDPRGGDSNQFLLRFGVALELIPSRRINWEEEAPALRREEQTPATPPPTPSTEPSFEQQVQARVREVTEGMERDRAQRVEETIGGVQDRIDDLRDRLSHARDGINRTNQMARVLEESTAELQRGAPLSARSRQGIESNLDALFQATELNGSGEPVSTTEESEDIRSGLRFIYSTMGAQNRYGNRTMRQLADLRDQLRRRHEDALAARTDAVLGRLTQYMSRVPQSIQAGDFQTDLQGIEQSMAMVESLETEYNLGSNPNWTQLGTLLGETRDQVAQMARSIDAISRFAQIFQGNTQYFDDQVTSPRQALATFQRAAEFLDQMPTSDLYRGVTLENLQNRYADYFGYLLYNLDMFIQFHTPPAMRAPAERRSWFQAVQRARELLCRLQATHSRCVATLESPPPRGPQVETGPRDPRRDRQPNPSPPPPPPPRRAPQASPPPPPPPPPPRSTGGRDAGTEVPPPPVGAPRRRILPPSQDGGV